MPYRDDRDDLEDVEWPEPEETGELDSESDLMPCPFCRKSVYDDAEQCPHCGNYMFSDEPESYRKPWWLLVGVGLSLLVVIYWLWPG